MTPKQPTSPRSVIRAFVEALTRLSASRARPRQGAGVAAAFSRRRRGGRVTLSWRITIPPERRSGLLRALAAAIARSSASIGAAVGCIRVVAGEEPVLFTVAPRVDVVANVLVSAFSRSEHNHALVALRDRAYLAEAVDPSAPFSADDDEIDAIVARPAARHVLVTRAERHAGEYVLAVELHGRRGELLHALAAARPYLAALREEVAASSSAPAAPKRSVNTRL